MTVASLTSRFFDALSGKNRKRVSSVIKRQRRSLLLENLEGRSMMAVVLTAGDIAFTGMQTDAPDSVSFVLLKTVDNSTTLTFTDNGWATAQNALANTTENTITVTFNSAYAAGTHFAIVDGGTPQFRLAGTTTTAGTVTGGSLSGLSSSGDSVLAYQGTLPTLGTATNWVAGISSNTWGSSTGTNFSALPTALVSGTHVVTFASEIDSQGLNLASVNGTTAQIRTAVNTATNWTRSDTLLNLVPPLTTFNVTAGTDPSLAISPVTLSLAEGNTGTTAYEFTVTRTVNTSVATSVNYALTNGTTNAADFSGATTGTVDFLANDVTKTFVILVAGDTDVEAAETFSVVLSGATGGATITTSTSNATITNDDSSFSVAALSASKVEGSSATTAFTFTVTRAGNLTTAATVDYSTAGSGANPTDAADFSGATTRTVSFAANAATATITLDVVGDTTAEPDETFLVTLANAVGTGLISASVGTPASATGTIQNDDAATQIAIAATDASKKEGNTATTPFTFTVTRSGVTTGTSSATWTVTGSGTNPATPATDFATITGTVSFAANETSQVVTIDVNGDTTIEPDEGFTVTLSSPSSGTAITTTAADGLIINDDLSVALPTTAISTTEGNSGSTLVSVVVTRTGDTSVATTVNWSVTATGTNPASASDFVGNALPSGSTVFAIGETTQTISFNIQGDVTGEFNETYTLTLDSATGGAAITTATQAGTIVNDDFTALSAGDIAFTGIRTDDPDTFSFVLLKSVDLATTITFTDNRWDGTALFSNENTMVVTFGQSYPAGTHFVFQNAASPAFRVIGSTTAAGTLSGAISGLAAGGDSILAYQGSAPTSAGSAAWIAGINSKAWNATATGNSDSGLPTAISSFAIQLSNTATDIDNGVYNPLTFTGSIAAIRASVNNIDNWTTSDILTSFPDAATVFTVTSVVTPTITGTPATKVYDGNAIAITATADDGPGNNAADTTGFTYTYYAAANLGGGPIAGNVAPTNVGSYSVDIAYAGNANYNPVTSTTFNFTITTATVIITAAPNTKVYGASDPALTYTPTGLIGGDMATGSLSRVAGENVGTYAINQGSVTAGSNYTVSYVGADLTINQALATVTADAKSKNVGDVDPALTFVATGLVNSDTQASVATGTLTRVAGAGPGTFAINQGTVSLGANYSVTYVGALLTINPAPVAPTFNGATVNGGDTFLTAAQRSQITSLVLTFSAPVNIASDAFTVANVGLFTAQTAAALASSQIIVTGSGTSTITLRWASGTGVVNRSGTGNRSNSLADGNWQLTIDSSKVTAVSNSLAMTGDNLFGDVPADNFFRMFGDSNGDGLLTSTDTAAFRAAFSASPSQNNAAFDWDGNGDVVNSGVDRTNFLGNSGKRRRTNFGAS